MLLRGATLFILISAICLGADIVCPPINFLNARSVNMTPSATSHLAVAYQADGSYTAYELANTSPYRVIRTTPHFERQFAGAQHARFQPAWCGIATRRDSRAWFRQLPDCQPH